MKYDKPTQTNWSGREVIKNARELKNINQKYLANQLGITQAYLSEIEGGKRKPSAKLMVKFSEILDVNLFSSKTEFDRQKIINDISEMKSNDIKAVKKAVNVLESNH